MKKFQFFQSNSIKSEKILTQKNYVACYNQLTELLTNNQTRQQQSTTKYLRLSAAFFTSSSPSDSL